MSHTRIVHLAHIISTNAQDIDAQLSAKGLPSPSFDPETPDDLLYGHGEEFEAARQAVMEATGELKMLVEGPRESIMGMFHNTLLSLQATLRFALYDFTGETSFADLAHRTGHDPSVLKRLLRHAISHRIFQEPRPGVLAHTALSKTLLDPGLRAYLSFTADELWPCATRTVDALERHPSAQDPARTGFNVAHGTERTFMEEMAREEARNQRYVDMLNTFRTRPEFASTSLVEALPWGTYGTVVDVGGSTGSVARDIVQRHEHVRVVVQDFAGPVAEGKRTLWPAYEGRIAFMEHDFFAEQPVHGADVYLLRWVLHDWSDTWAMKILRALIPALKRGARVVLNEMVVPPDHVVGNSTRRFLRMMDLTMLELHNGKERDGEDWAKLFAACDGRFRFEGARALPGAALGLVEAVWDP